MKAQRKFRSIPRALAVAALATLTLAAPATPASAATTTQEAANAFWTIDEGCVQTTISLQGFRTPSGTTTSYFLDQSSSCSGPVVPVVQIRGQIDGGQLHTSPNFTGHLVATVPTTCEEFAEDACRESIYNWGSVTLDLSWDTAGHFVRAPVDGMNCRWRYGQVTGAILLGPFNVLVPQSGPLSADPTESNIMRCVTARRAA